MADHHFFGEQSGEGIQCKPVSAHPASPPANRRRVYPFSDGWYEKDSSGNVRKLAPLVTGTAAPGGSVSAPEGTFYWDTDDNLLYVNNDGATGWTAVAMVATGAANRVAYFSAGSVLTSDADFTLDGTTLGISGALALEPASPAQITADQNDYAPAADAQRSVWRLSTDATRTITGIVAPTASKVLHIINVGSNILRLSNQDAASTAANRIITGTGGSVLLHGDDSAQLWYDLTTSRWRVL